MIQFEGFKIIGLTVRTTNENDQSSKDIGQLWEQFYANNVLVKIPNKINNEVYSIYTDYTSDHTGEYTTIIGAAVTSLDNIPDKLIGRIFQPDNFEVFTAKGQMPQAIINTWFNIWKQDNELQRKYSYDFEVYGDNSQKDDCSEIQIFVATNKMK